MMGKQISRPQADNGTQRHKHMSTNLELNVTLDGKLWFICKRIDQMSERVLANFSLKYSSYLLHLMGDFEQISKNSCGCYHEQELNFYVPFRYRFFYSYLIEKTNKSLMIELTFFSPMLMTQATKENSLISINLGFFFF